MTIAAIGPTGERHRFADTPAFMAWFTSAAHPCGVTRVLNADPDHPEGDPAHPPTTAAASHVGSPSGWSETVPNYSPEAS